MVVTGRPKSGVELGVVVEATLATLATPCPKVDWVAGAAAAIEFPNLLWPNKDDKPASGVVAGVVAETGWPKRVGVVVAAGT